ncbi:MAG: HAD-IA family hydrolase [Mariprofundaceae bacterium]
MSSPDTTPPHLILFDCDGTLTDSHGAIVTAMQQAFESSNLTPPSDETVQRVIGLSLEGAVERLSPDASSSEKIIEDYREYYVAGEAMISLYPGVIETLDELKERGYWMAVVTGKSKPGLIRVLEQFNLRDYFYAIRTADCTHSKPHPAMAMECMEELGASKENTSLVGDALFDMEMANAASVRAYGVSFGVESAGALYAAGAYDVVDDFPALLGHFPPLSLRSEPATINTTGVK